MLCDCLRFLRTILYMKFICDLDSSNYNLLFLNKIILKGYS